MVLASVYALRMYIRAMHNRAGPTVTSFELSLRDALVLVPLVLRDPRVRALPAAGADDAGEPASGRHAPCRAAGGHARDAAAPTVIATPPPRRPHIDWEALSPLVALAGGACIVLLVGLLRSRFVRTQVVPLLALVTLGVTAGLGVWQWGDQHRRSSSGALAIDDLTLALTMVFVVAAASAAVLLSWRSLAAAEAGEGEYYALLLSSVLGMVVLVARQNLVVLFLGFELLSIPLYVLCATHMRREHSLESGLKYLIIGSVGSATLLYGLALLYGATGSTDFAGDRRGGRRMLSNDVLLLTGVALVVAGLAFKASVAPFHQWTPDVYEGAPTPVTAFMAVATKAAAFGVLLRLFDVALIDAATTWGPALAVLAAITIVVGNVGAIGQSSLKRLLAYSSVAQAGYMLAGVVVSTRLGVQATVFYLAVYPLMNLAAFAVIVARERETGLGDDISSLYGLGADAAVARVADDDRDARAGRLPGHGGLLREDLPDRGGRRQRLRLARRRDRARLGDLARVLPARDRRGLDALAVARRWRGRALTPGGRPAIGRRVGRGRREAAAAATARCQLEVLFVAVLCAAATVVFGIYPDPLMDIARDAGAALTSLVS